MEFSVLSGGFPIMVDFVVEGVVAYLFVEEL